MGIGAPEIILIIIAFGGMWFIPAIWGYNAGSKRTIGSVGGLLLGLFLSIFGVIIVYCTRRIDEKPFYGFPNQSPADELQKYKQLLDSGAITENEYNIQKGRILNSN
ncbi:SHOCT domain-containing protein [Mucilaginibacter sp. OK283]|uniref:SHOCT domain-containing protein n=1 Tax=Mucilaginibacter sp. OK283 TaxID=1881049 RepID=UPI0008B2BD4F|nr:SHOCT domain-containing protein [Mucilaginibacter sp. OK283]SEP42461.1 Short C-terminal domain-containing protein [Mucilaginibacter sp. OK283]